MLRHGFVQALSLLKCKEKHGYRTRVCDGRILPTVRFLALFGRVPCVRLVPDRGRLSPLSEPSVRYRVAGVGRAASFFRTAGCAARTWSPIRSSVSSDRVVRTSVGRGRTDEPYRNCFRRILRLTVECALTKLRSFIRRGLRGGLRPHDRTTARSPREINR